MCSSPFARSLATRPRAASLRGSPCLDLNLEADIHGRQEGNVIDSFYHALDAFNGSWPTNVDIVKNYMTYLYR
ncbi:hypothetical protein OH76DRAFT_1174660 [Lentinus brumalis]|uniref:Uncharacterized protein n=1 Tax=Lentinus brumalis TaxID=2498619 RepID=A0A371CU28_9APHY|nr:hypothetical protein OH76DRAFT_1174660 [Polyporus brumalis]